MGRTALNPVLCVMGGLGFGFVSVDGGYTCNRIVSSAEAEGKE